jgi:glyoxylase-like metal-dependent hydrolase (beta-lactamase superfamily II)
MKIAEGLEMLEIRAEMFGNAMVYHPTIIWDEAEMILIDAGFPGQSELIREEILRSGAPMDRLNKIIITHQDMDHIGSLSSLVQASSNKIEVLSHEAERPYIEGELTPIKMTPERIAQREAMINTMPEEKKKEYKKMLANIPCKVDITVDDGQELPFCGGIVIIHTPGHTPGHICLYLKKYKTLITGDALNVVEGKLCGPAPQHTYNLEEAIESLKKITWYDIQTVICYHGGIYTNNPNEKIKDLIAGN